MWQVEYLKEAIKDLMRLDHSQRLQVLGLRVVYKLVREKEVMKIIIISARADDEVYLLAQKRIDK
ncbi:hypothetical protein SAMN02745885_00556 [Carboxydocella sporoproducens DSM 16521]|uniref:mRNA interferase RelE/StbE n=2 Tax=Carboxydocella TaxID=178898 RepID=A0A1T4MG06_9FIRM|nr:MULTISPECIES: hypothetical protein [Carboxydocella]AVX21312.1 hypothetical protein CFE_2149 [Carboxydocella thermautotrophica]AVX31743.1 hypothetical protein CTH_2181 [Carboxydocella thermautotrophica]SJZ65704.1 hypothetical protein SAMN02745885_00556 [Carboxydocella sporoproducens DSM 16521]